MSTPILTTKLYAPPTQPKFVPRSRLIDRLNEGLYRNLTLISAPAGFGKTTLVSSWIDNLYAKTASQKEIVNPKSKIANQVAWLSLDEADNDTARFFGYFIAALQRINPEIGQSVQNMLQSPQPPPFETLMTTLINEISTCFTGNRCVLVLDDYHLIQTKPIDDGLTFLLDHLPPSPRGIHLVIATRDDPHLPLARLRAGDQLTEVRAADLRFTTSEAAEFLNQAMDLNLSAQDVAALETRTEGWIAGLQLAALSMQRHEDAASFIKSFTGSHHFVLDYLIEEVLGQQPENIQAFLLQTSILDQLTGSLCDAVCSEETASGLDSSGQKTLETLEHANLFIVPLDNDRRWYRYHHLFGDLLRQQLHLIYPAQVPTLYIRASDWFHQHGYADEAIEYALRARDFERAATLLEDQFGENYERVDQTILRRWLAEMPEEFVLSRPHLCILQAWTMFTTGQLDVADQRLQAAEKLLDPDIDQASVATPNKEQLLDTNRMTLIGRIAAIRAILASYSDDILETIRYARQALEHLPEQERAWRGAVFITLGDAYANLGDIEAAHKARTDALLTSKASGDPYLVMIVNLRLAEILRQQGRLQQVVDICENQFEEAEKNGILEWTIAGWLFGTWGEVLAELNNLDSAINKAEKAAKLTAHGGDLLYEVMSNLCLVRVLFSSGDITSADEVIQAMQKTARQNEIPLWAMYQLSAWQVRVWLAQDKLEVASQWAVECGLNPDVEPTYLREVEYIAFARILIAQGQLDEATAFLTRLLGAAESGGRTSRAIEILILQSLAAQSAGSTVQAMSTLEQALTLARPGGHIRIFVDEGPPMAHLLFEAFKRDILPGYSSQLLAAFSAGQSEPEQAVPSINQNLANLELIEPLSERELEILQLIAEGLTNREIASKIFVTVNTVKAHAHNIYSKLGVNKRTQAVARARALRIISFD